MGHELGPAIAAELRAAACNAQGYRQHTQREIAASLGISQPTVCRYEKDASTIPLRLLAQWSRGLGVELDELFKRAQARGGFTLECT